MTKVFHTKESKDGLQMMSLPKESINELSLKPSVLFVNSFLF